MAKLAIRIIGQPDQVVLLPEAGAVLGREASCGIVLDDGAVSRRHCEIRPCEGGFRLSDLGGRNPVLCNGERVTGSVDLLTGDLIRIGRVELLFVFSPEEVRREDDAVVDDPVEPAALDQPAEPAEMSERDERTGQPDRVSEERNDASVEVAAEPAVAAQEPSAADVAFPVLTGRTAYEAIDPEEFAQPPLPPLAQRTPTDALPVFLPQEARAGKRSRAQERREASDIPEGLSPQQLAELRVLRARNDFWAKVIIFLLFGIPFVLIDLYLIWYFFLE